VVSHTLSLSLPAQAGNPVRTQRSVVLDRPVKPGDDNGEDIA